MPNETLPIRILHLEDNRQDAELIRDRLDEDGLPFTLTHVATKDDFELAITGGKFDVVLCDYNIPGYDGIAALACARARHPHTPVLLISGSLGEEAAVECLHLGATDYIIKDRLKRLGVAIRRALAEAETHLQRRETEAALRASEERFRMLVENSSDIIFEASLEGIFLYLSPNFSTITGHRVAEILGKSIFDHIHPDDLTGAQEEFGKPDMRKQLRYQHADGGYRWFEVQGRIFATPDGLQRASFVARDVTDRRKLEEDLRQAYKMESVGQLAGGVAHDFNNILTVILGQASLLGFEPGLSSAMREALSEITEAAERAATLTRQLLTFSRKQVIQPCDLDLNTVVKEVIRLLRRTLGEDITLAVNLSDGLPIIHADPAMIQQILLNLAVNARDAMPQGGRLDISTFAVQIGPEELSLNSEAIPGPAVCLRVSDDGCGIPAHVVPHIFEPFFTTKEVGKGTGLGLATVHGIVKQHHGWIRLNSAIGEGTAFLIYIPAQSAGVVRQDTTFSGASGPSGAGNVLVVDDDSAVRHTSSFLLKRLGYTVIEAVSGVHALDLVERLAPPIDLLLTDLVMPGGLSGTDLAQALRQKIPGLRVLYTSGYSLQMVEQGIPEKERGCFLQKPYSTRAFAKSVHDCIADRVSD